MTLLLLLAGCQEYNIDFKGQDPGFDTGGPADTEPAHDTADTTLPTELCNGVDDDGDGLVDEGYPDDDGNGVVDCLDTSCPALTLGAAGTVAARAECEGLPFIPDTPVADPWNVRVKWAIARTSANDSFVTPVVGNLTDDDGDGDIDQDDDPEILVVAVSGGRLSVIDGRTGAIEWQHLGFNDSCAPVIADVTGDGRPDIVSVSDDFYPEAGSGDGTLEWRATTTAARASTPMVDVADLDEDGHPEVIAYDGVFDGETGAFLFPLTPSTPYDLRSDAIGDVDLDGDQEIFYGGRLWDSDGTLLWDSGLYPWATAFPLLVQADADPEAEIAVASETFAVFDTDGTLLSESAPFPNGAAAGPPCAGDFDGDGAMEVAFPIYTDGGFVSYELDGTLAWHTTAPWRTYDAGCAGFDFDGDGALEILYPADEGLYIYDGRTGDTLYEDLDHASGTYSEYATVADVDHDDHADVVFVSNGTVDNALTVLENAADGWPAAGPTWPEFDYAVTNVSADNTVPASPDPSWLTNTVYRSRTALDGTPSLADLVVDITDVCVADCTWGPVAVGIQVSNEGAADVPAGAVVSLYAEGDDGPRLVATQTLPAVPAGTLLDGVQIDLTPADIGTHGFTAVVDDGTGVGDVYECDETDNRDSWEEEYCP